MLAFPTRVFGEKPNFSNFNRDEWQPRKHVDMLKASVAYHNGKTEKERSEIQPLSGVRYSILRELPYFDASRRL